MTHKILCRVCDKLITAHTDSDLTHCNLVSTLMVFVVDEPIDKKVKKVK